MSTIQFDRNSRARWYAKQHLKTDPGIKEIYFLPTNAPEREIRLVEINTLIANRSDDALEAVDFGVDLGTESEHRLFVLDVTPDQWTRIHNKSLNLPTGWTLVDAVPY